MAIVTGILALAHSLRMNVVAEGVETVAQQSPARRSATSCRYLSQAAASRSHRDPVAVPKRKSARRRNKT